jgi:hypothetical protein
VEKILSGKSEHVEYQFHHDRTPYYIARLICYNSPEAQEAKDSALSYLGSEIFSEKGLTKLIGAYSDIKRIMVSEKQRASQDDEEGRDNGSENEDNGSDDEGSESIFTRRWI